MVLRWLWPAAGEAGARCPVVCVRVSGPDDVRTAHVNIVTNREAATKLLNAVNDLTVKAGDHVPDGFHESIANLVARAQVHAILDLADAVREATRAWAK